MSLVRVFIATTTGPVAVQRITEEDPEVSSVVCLAGKAMALPISQAYNAFVRNPTGVVQRHFGHPAFRVDVSEKIDEGYSWQLGLFIAHALHKAGRLGGRDSEVETVVVATGEVDRDLNVLAVNGVAEKIDSLRAVFGDILAGDARLLIAVPGDNPEPWRKIFIDDVELGRGRVQVLAVDSAADLLDVLGAPLPERPHPTAATKPTASPRRGRTMVLAGLLTLVAMGALAGGATYAPEIKDWAGRMAKMAAAMVVPAEPENGPPQPRPTPTPQPIARPEPEKLVQTAPTPTPVAAPQPTPPTHAAPPEPATAPQKLDVTMPPRKPTTPPRPESRPEVGPDTEKDIIETARLNDPTQVPVDIQVIELRAPTGHSCAAVRDKRVEARVRRASRGDSDVRGPDGVNDLCTIEIRAAARRAGQTLIGRYQRWTRSRPDQAEPDKVIDLGPRDDALTWSVDIPSRLQRRAFFHVVVLSSAVDVDIPQRLMRRLQQAQFGSAEMRAVVRRLRGRGIEVTSKRFRVNPGESRQREDWRRDDRPPFDRPPPPDRRYPPPYPQRGYPPPPPRG